MTAGVHWADGKPCKCQPSEDTATVGRLTTLLADARLRVAKVIGVGELARALKGDQS
jgi:hypothetical protein